MVYDKTTRTFGPKSHTFRSEMTPAYLDASNTGRGQGQAALPEAALWAKPASLVASPTPTPTAPCPPRHPAENVPPEASKSLPSPERPGPLQHQLDLSPAQSDLEPSVWRPCWAVEPDLTQDGPSSAAGSSCPAAPDPRAPSPGPQLHFPLSRCSGRYTEQRHCWLGDPDSHPPAHWTRLRVSLSTHPSLPARPTVGLPLKAAPLLGLLLVPCLFWSQSPSRWEEDRGWWSAPPAADRLQQLALPWPGSPLASGPLQVTGEALPLALHCPVALDAPATCAAFRPTAATADPTRCHSIA